ncbi:coadhesin-like [Patella vulgata]|uniref:coadhesin-like n=1 Tax=Patella vulgata TaxID=6465 RepID=UPI0024A8C0D4|nr:coadhesin-like [Patella vulgata]
MSTQCVVVSEKIQYLFDDSNTLSGLWGAWLPYSACSVTCGGGQKIRTRDCDSPAPAYGGDACPGIGSETLPCNTQVCPVDGNWGSWSTFGSCTVTCGGGTQTRTRVCDSPVPANGGNTCPGSTTDNQACNSVACPVDGIWGAWSSYGSCTVTCGGGTQTRSRSCDNPAPVNGGATCSGSSTENQPCSTALCQVDGIWGAWSSYGSCTVTCGGGTQTRSRSCDNPAPANGGATCSGSSTENQPCSTALCQVDGIWGAWSSYGSCTVTCGGGTQTRSRSCDNPAPANGGATCSGSSTENQPCSTALCQVNGNWEVWSSYGSCTVTCGGGTQTRSRTCDNPAPANGGTTCSGSATEDQSCGTAACPVDGIWGAWSSYGSCTVTCGDGTQTRSRTCDNPAPANGGATCSGSSTEDQPCSAALCLVNGNWGVWSNYGTCTVTCGGGTQTRSRTCDNPAPANGGTTCSGSATENQSCGTTACPVNGNWGPWSNYGSCPVTCGSGTKARSRSCNNPAPANGGAPCPGSYSEDMQCNTDLCPDTKCASYGSYSYDQSTGVCITISSAPSNFDGALSACTGSGGTLFKMDSIAKRNYVQKLLTDNGINDDSIFIGAKDKDSTDTFVWMDDTPVVWIGTDPTTTNQNCVRIDTTKSPIEMDETGCGSSYKYICEQSV